MRLMQGKSTEGSAESVKYEKRGVHNSSGGGGKAAHNPHRINQNSLNSAAQTAKPNLQKANFVSPYNYKEESLILNNP